MTSRRLVLAAVAAAPTGEEDPVETTRFPPLRGAVRGTALLLLSLEARRLEIGERAGLSGLPAYQVARDDARKLQTAGAVVRRRANDTTVELNLQIR